MSADVSLLPARPATAREALEDHATVLERAANRVTSTAHIEVLREAAVEARAEARRMARQGADQ